ncbi:hypothetical protein [Sphingomonas sp. CROZ-RG-20F-R02-07]|uniref:hypothetical protein n=1 Tax=Sphingomonas sp. CROZ-RG-20F-R02-07 TaxID=2914832 RepID=UPI001F5679F3|nr:hypothetical protein [Sphingomonas sp. CROZ-RG-20F-R02-07]
MLMMPMLLLAGDPDAPPTILPATLIANALARTTAEHRCTPDPDSTDVTVCGLRGADRFRVPFAQHAVARTDDVTATRAALLHERTPMEEMGPFLVGGGMAGVHAGTSFGPGAESGKASVGGLRPLAP